MKTYIFSIFVRGFIALSGFIVVAISAQLFGAEGRGIISYGTSMFATFGLLFSFNLGRSFLGKTIQNENQKDDLIFSFFLLSILAIFLTALSGVIYWKLLPSAQEIVSTELIFPLLLSSFFYVWNVNGNSFFAAFQKTFQQEIVIFLTRLSLVVLLIVFYFLKSKDLSSFILMYTLTLSLGVIIEFTFLFRMLGLHHQKPDFKKMRSVFKDSFWPHTDFLAFNIYPMLIILISGQYLDNSKIGLINITIQIVSLILLLSTTAHIRVSAYVSNFGYKNKMYQIKKLFNGTLLLSTLLTLFILLALNYLEDTAKLGSFNGILSLFKIAIISIPGYMIYQFINPIIYEIKEIKLSAVANVICALISLALTPFLIQNFQEKGCLISYSLFYTSIIIGQLFIFLTKRGAQ